MKKITNEIVVRILSVIDQGLTAGMGSPMPGMMGLEPAVCYALGEPHGDKPPGVAISLSLFANGLNDTIWNNNQTRAQGLRRLAIAQLATEEVLCQTQFVERLIRRSITSEMPKIFRSLANLLQEPHKTTLLKAANLLETDATTASRTAATLVAAALAAHTEARAMRADQAVLAAVRKAAMATAEALHLAAALTASLGNSLALGVTAFVTSHRAIDYTIKTAHLAASLASNLLASDQILSDFAEEAVQILVKMNTPGSKFLYLTE